MAEGGIDFTTCSVCLDTFKTPRILITCGHTFCSECLKTLIESGRRNCPDCRNDIPDQSIDKFPINYAVVSAIGSNFEQMKRPASVKFKTDNCDTHKLPKLTYCRGPNCLVAICMECWQIDHKTTPHEVVPLKTELELMRKAAATNTNSLVDFQSSIQSLMEQLTKTSSKARELFEGTESLVAYQLKVNSEQSLIQLQSYNDEMLKLCKLKQKETQGIDEEVKLLTMASTKARKQLDNLMSRVQQDNSPTVADKQHPKEPAEPAALASKKLTRFREVVGKTFEELGFNYKRIFLAAASITTRQIFLSLDGKEIIELDFELRALHSFIFKSGEIMQIAVSGDGTLYVSYCRQGKQTMVTSAVDKKNGSILRNIHSSDKDMYHMRAFDNRLVIIYNSYRKAQKKHHLFVFDNQKLIRSIEVVDIVYDGIVSHSYMMCKKSVEWKWHLMLINIDSSSSSESQHKLIQLEEEGDIFRRPFWIPKPSEVDTNTADGYIVINQWTHDNKLKVYETDLDNVEDGAKLQSRQILLTSNNEYRHIWFVSALGDDLVLCRLMTKNKAAKIAVLRFEFN